MKNSGTYTGRLNSSNISKVETAETPNNLTFDATKKGKMEVYDDILKKHLYRPDLAAKLVLKPDNIFKNPKASPLLNKEGGLPQSPFTIASGRKVFAIKIFLNNLD